MLARIALKKPPHCVRGIPSKLANRAPTPEMLRSGMGEMPVPPLLKLTQRIQSRNYRLD